MKKAIALTLPILIHLACFAQAPITELDFGQNSLRGALRSGDSICIFFQKNSGRQYGKIMASWIPPSGTHNQFPIDSVDYKRVIAVRTSEGREWYYSVVTKKGQQYLTAATRNQRSGAWSVEPVQLPLPAPVLGVRRTELGIQLMCLAPEQTALSLVEVKGLDVTREFVHNINVPLLGKRTSVVVTTPEHPLRPEQALATMKVYWTSESITIVSDLRYEEFGDDPGLYKTEVCQIDIATGTTVNKFFAHPNKSYFNSFYHNDHLYRLVREAQMPYIQVFQMTTGQSRNTTYLSPIAEHSNRSSYRARYSQKIKQKKLRRATAWPNYIVAESVPDGVVLRVGRQEISDVTIFVPLPPVTALAATIAVAATTLSILSPPVVEEDYFFYLKGAPNAGFTYDDSTTSVDQHLTRHWLSTEDSPYQHRYHLYGRDFGYSIEHSRKLKTVRVTRVEASK